MEMDYIKELLPNLFLLGFFVVMVIVAIAIVSIAWLIIVTQFLIEVFGVDDINKFGRKKYLIIFIGGPAAWVIHSQEAWTSYLMNREHNKRVK